MEQKKYSKEQLDEFEDELKRQTKFENRYDINVPTTTKQLRMVTDGKTLQLVVPQINTPAKLHTLTKYAQHQIAQLYGLHASYFEKLKTSTVRSEKKLHLICENINEWIPETEKGKRLIRVLDNEVIGYLGPNYLCINNHDLYCVAKDKLDEIAKNTGITYEFQRADFTDSHLYLKIISPQLVDEVYHYKKVGEPVQGGIIIRNSEVGDGAFTIEPYINVLACTNGMIQTKILKKVHRTNEQGIGEINQKQLQARLEVIYEDLRDAIEKTFTPEIFHKWVDEINGKAQVEIPKPTLAVDNLITHFKLSKTLKDTITNQYVKEASPTVWGLAMAVTRIAQDRPDYEEQIELERIGAKILKMNPKVLVKEIEVEE